MAIILSGLFGGLIGYCVGQLGFDIGTWQYWAIVAPVAFIGGFVVTSFWHRYMKI